MAAENEFRSAVWNSAKSRALNENLALDDQIIQVVNFQCRGLKKKGISPGTGSIARPRLQTVLEDVFMASG
jgi:hypothetical protein